jgi:hypothetical protein
LKYREYLFTRIHEICFYGQGGYDWNTVYYMPIMYREFIYQKIRSHYENKNKPNNEGQNKSLNKTGQTVKPNNTTYTAKKASKK